MLERESIGGIIDERVEVLLEEEDLEKETGIMGIFIKDFTFFTHTNMKQENQIM